jgi:hypothetical protein
MMLRAVALLSAMAAGTGAARSQPAKGDDPLSLFGQDVSAAVDRAVNLSVFAAVCNLGSEAAARNLRDAVSRRLAECFRTDSKAASWGADVQKQFDGQRALLLDVARKRGRDATCSVLYEGDGRQLSPFGLEVAADSRRYEVSAATAPIASRPCP